MVCAPSPEEEDRRRLTRERGALLKERIRHTNWVKGLLSGQGVRDYNPLRRDRYERLDALRTGDRAGAAGAAEGLKSGGSPSGSRWRRRNWPRSNGPATRSFAREAKEGNNPAGLLLKLKGIGPEFASLLWLEALFRSFVNRRQVAAYGGLAPSPWQSGAIERDQGISKSGNRRLRKTMIELAWLWLRHQPNSTLSRWFRAGSAPRRGGSAGSASWRWPANCSSPCGAMSPKASFPRAPYSRRPDPTAQSRSSNLNLKDDQNPRMPPRMNEPGA